MAELQEKNKNIEVSFFVPQIMLKPIINGTLRYTYSIRQPGSSAHGMAGDFSSYVERETGDSDWIYNRIPMINADKVEMLTHFDTSDFDKLGLKFVEKFYLDDRKSGKVKLDFSPIPDVKDFESINSNGFSHAFYKFATVRNSMPLTVVFGVTEKQYDPQDPYPRNWFYLYMKCDKE